MDATMMETNRHGPKVEYEHSENSSTSQDDLCPICHISVGAETPDHVVESWASLPCGHRFGCHCLKSWLGMAEPPACPMCRQDMAHICGHPYLPRPVVVKAAGPSSTHVEDLAKQANEDQPAQSGASGASRRRSRRLMAKEAAAAAAAAAGRVATAADPAGPVASAPIAIPSSSTYQRPSTPTPSFPSPSSSPGFSSSSASSPTFSSSSVSTGSVPDSPLSAVSIQVAATPAEIKATTKPSAAKQISLETLFPRAPPVDAACTYCFSFLENQYKEELRAEEAAAAQKARTAVSATVAAATAVEVVVSDASAGANDCAIDLSYETLSDNENEDDDEEDGSDDDDCDDHMIMLSCSRKDRIVQMAMGVFASGCADSSRLSGEERRKVAAHWERWRISHAKVFSAWWATQTPHTEPAIERRTQGWVH